MMKLNFKKVMKNEMVLYVLVFLAFANVASFLSNGDYESAVLFVALSVLTSHFTKNKVIVLLVALFVTQLMKRRVREGMKHGKDNKSSKKSHDEDDEDNEDDEEEEGMTTLNKKEKTGKGKTGKGKTEKFSSGKIDQAATLKKAYNNLDGILGKGGMEGVTKDTSALIKQQQQLMKQIEAATPVLNNAMKMMESETFQKIASGDHMKGMDKMQGMFEKLTGGMNGGKAHSEKTE